MKGYLKMHRNRRDFLKMGAMGAAGLALAPMLSTAQEKAKSDRPNIVLVMTDDQGWGDTGYNGHPVIKTPVLDEMARTGARFDRFYSSHPLCGPTRASVLTGRNNNRAGVFVPGYALPPDEVTIAQWLKDAGYATGHFGKWHLGGVTADAPSNPSAFGFDEWVSAINFYSVNPIFSRMGEAEQQKGEGSLLTVKEAIRFIDRQAAQERPFFAVVWFGAVHGPQKTTSEFTDLYADQPEPVAKYAGMTTAMDAAVGQLREALDEAGVRENTLLWFCSDNGGAGPVTVTGGRGKKRMMWEGGLRVPGLIEWPAVVRQPLVTALPASTSDIYPTLLEAVDLPPEERLLDGVSLMPLLRTGRQERPPIGFWFMATFQEGDRWSVVPPRSSMDRSDPSPNRGFKQTHYGYMAPMLAAQRAGEPLSREFSDISTGLAKTPWPETRLTGHAAWLEWPWKLHRIQKDEANVEWKLYNLADDPMESRDRLGDQRKRVAAMQAALQDWQRSVIRSLNRRNS